MCHRCYIENQIRVLQKTFFVLCCIPSHSPHLLRCLAELLFQYYCVQASVFLPQSLFGAVTDCSPSIVVFAHLLHYGPYLDFTDSLCQVGAPFCTPFAIEESLLSVSRFIMWMMALIMIFM